MNLHDPVRLLDSIKLSKSAILNLLFAMATHVACAPSGHMSLSTMCASSPCRNGQCYAVGSEIKCLCDIIFKGDECQDVNMDAVTHSMIGTALVFKWSEPPRLQGYYFVYYRLDSEQLVLFKNAIRMDDNENAVIVGDLQHAKSVYRICIEDEFVADLAVSTKSTEGLRNCIEIETQPDFHTMAGYFIWVMLFALVVLIMYWQRDKIEFLYFQKPTHMYYADRPIQAEQDDPEQSGETRAPSQEEAA